MMPRIEEEELLIRLYRRVVIDWQTGNPQVLLLAWPVHAKRRVTPAVVQCPTCGKPGRVVDE